MTIKRVEIEFICVNTDRPTAEFIARIKIFVVDVMGKRKIIIAWAGLFLQLTSLIDNYSVH